MMDLKKLSEPFPSKDIEWRVQSAGEKNNRPWARVLAYVTNRAIMDRLDDICGCDGWQNEKPVAGPQGGVLSGIKIKCGDEWLTKWDGAENTEFEPVKGGLSGAMKRAAVQWGIGRYLYNLEAGYAEISTNGKHYQPEDKKNHKYQAFKWDPPALPVWALPVKTENTPESFPVKPDTKLIDEWYASFRGCETITDLQEAFPAAIKSTKFETDKQAIIAAKNIRKKELA